MKPFHLYCGVEPLHMAPTCLFLSILMGVVAEAHSNNVVHSKDFLDDSYDGGLCLPLEEVVGDKCHANSKL